MGVKITKLVAPDDTSLILLAFMGLTFLMSLGILINTALLLHGQLAPWQFWAAFGTAFTPLLCSRRLDPRQRLRVGGWFIGILVISIGVSALVSDFSYDGQGYHQAIMYALNTGWNPYYENIFNRTDIVSQNKIWIETYPYLSQATSLVVVKATGMLNAGKYYTIFLAFIAWILTYVSLKRNRVYPWFAALLASVAICNPIVILQASTYGLDGSFYCLLVIFLSLGLMLLSSRKSNYIYLGLGIVTILLINNKLTSGLYAAMFAVLMIVVFLILKKFRESMKFTVVVAGAFVIGIFIFGYHPFVTNVTTYGHPLYPIYSTTKLSSAYDYNENRPSNYRSIDQSRLFLSSLFFKSNGYFRPPLDVAVLKMPFTYSSSELYAFTYLGPKQGGFGVLFSGIIILLFLLLGFMFVFNKQVRGKKGQITVVLLLAGGIIGSSLINPLNNVARYIPQLWLIIPIGLYVAALYRKSIMVVLSAIIIFVVATDVMLVAYVDVRYAVSHSVRLDSYLNSLKSSSSPLLVDFYQSEGNRLLLNQYGIRYTAYSGSHELFQCPDGRQPKPLLGNIGQSSARACM